MKKLEVKLNNWVASQDVKSWAKFTLEFPRFSSSSMWDIPLSRTFKILEKTYPRTSIKRLRKHDQMLPLRYVTILGGDRSSGVALHAQGLIEVLDDPGLFRLKNALEKAWVSSIHQHLKHQKWNATDVVLQEAKAWVEPLEGDTKEYTVYLNRFEGTQLGFGVDKLVLSATALMN